MKYKFSLTLIFTLSLIINAYSQTWWDSQWLNRTKITFDNTASNEDLIDFPLLVSFTNANIDFDKIEPLGVDIRFVDGDDATPLDYEIEKWDDVGETATVWVNVQQIDNNSNTDFIYIYYNNTDASDDQDPAGVWNNDYEGVWHLDETSGSAMDATSNSHDGTYIGTSFPSQVDGAIGKAQDFEYDNNNYIDLPDESSFDYSSEMSVSAWVKVESWSVTFACIVSKGGTSWAIQRWNDTNFGNFGVGGDPISVGADDDINDGAWHFTVGTYDGSTLRFYVDGVADGTRVRDLGGLNDINVQIGGHDNRAWRKGIIESNIRDYSRKGIPLFY